MIHIGVQAFQTKYTPFRSSVLSTEPPDKSLLQSTLLSGREGLKQFGLLHTCNWYLFYTRCVVSVGHRSPTRKGYLVYTRYVVSLGHRSEQNRSSPDVLPVLLWSSLSRHTCPEGFRQSLVSFCVTGAGF